MIREKYKAILIISFFFNIAIACYFGGKRFYYTHWAYFHPPESIEQRWIGILKAKPDSLEIQFFGTSLTNNFALSTAFKNPHIKNLGFSGSKTNAILADVKKAIVRTPKKIFLEAGINDLRNDRDATIDSAYQNIVKIVDVVQSRSPKTKLYIQSLFPTDSVEYNSKIVALNQRLLQLSKSKGCVYIDLYSRFLKNGQLDRAVTTDGIHLNEIGYFLWRKSIDSSIED